MGYRPIASEIIIAIIHDDSYDGEGDDNYLDSMPCMHFHNEIRML